MKASTKEEVGQLVAELERQQKTKRDVITPSWGIQANDAWEGEPTFRVWEGADTQPLTLTASRTAHNQLAEKVGIPWNYYQRLQQAPHLWAENVNHWQEEGKKNVLVRMLDGRVRAFLSDRYRVLDNYDLFFEAFKVARDVGAEITRADLTDDGGSFYARFIHPEWRERIAVQQAQGLSPGSHQFFDPTEGGELVVPGVIVSNSETGKGGLRASPFVHFLACSNGLVRDGELFQVHLGRQQGEGSYMSDETRRMEDFTLWSKVRDLIRATFDRDLFRKMIGEVRETARAELEHPVEAVDLVVKHFGMTDEDRQAILDELISPSIGFDRGRTVYGLANAVTARAHAYEEDPDRMLEFERAGADLIFKRGGMAIAVR